ncbi:MAG: T9SS type A sorting domain-containing protein [Fimbriimonadaceae bacterium]|nr:T9SS type A sorting domain-containing protein [Chitinophagales bacterium]
MKKILYPLFTFFIIHTAQTQNATAIKNKQLKDQLLIIPHFGFTEYAKKNSATPFNENVFYAKAASRAGGDFVGNTTYDLPTNNTSPNRLLVYEDGTVSAAWTGSTSTSTERPDRGTFFNHSNGSTWGEIPVERIEEYRTGFPAIIYIDGHEMFFAHDGLNNIAIFENDAPGSETWTENSNSLLLKGTWPRAACAPGSNYIHLLIANDDAGNDNGYMLYYRSSDAGATWDIQGLRLPGVDTASGYNIMGAECYTIKAIGSEVYIAAGSKINDLAVWRSSSNGDIGSWTRTRLIEFPISNFDGNEISDITGDAIADTIGTHDGSIALAIDNAGKMHVWTGVTNVLDITPGDKAWNYFPGVAGMFYWNESFGEDSVQYLTFPIVDWDDDGDPFAGIGFDLANYGVGLTSQPAAALDPSTGSMYIVYTHQVEYTDYVGDPNSTDAQSFRDLFGFYTTDGGNTWSDPINISYTAEDYYENINPTLYWNSMDDKIHTLWMQDQDPGNSLDTEDPDAITLNNNIIYRAYDYSRFEPYDPTANFDYTITFNSVAFHNLSADAGTYLWNFDEGGDLSNLKDPVNIFDETGDYTVCLTATNKYGNDEDCKTITITELVNIDDVTFNNNISVYPTLATDIINIEMQNIEDDVAVEIYSLQGEKVFEQTLNGNTTIDISTFSAGEYILKFSSQHAAAVKRIAIAK